MEMRRCKDCGRELPLSAFKKTRWGGYANTCNECVREKRSQTRYDRVNSVGGGGVKPLPFPMRTSMGKTRARSSIRWYAAASGLNHAASR